MYRIVVNALHRAWCACRPIHEVKRQLSKVSCLGLDIFSAVLLLKGGSVQHLRIF